MLVGQGLRCHTILVALVLGGGSVWGGCAASDATPGVSSGAGGASTAAGGAGDGGGIGGSTVGGAAGGAAGGQSEGGGTPTSDGGMDASGGATPDAGAGSDGANTDPGGSDAGAGSTRAYNPCPTDGSPCKILPFGDSITQGVKSSDDAGYRSRLFKLIVAAKQKVTFTGSLTNGPTQVSGQTFPRMHEGHPGWTIDPGYNAISSSYGGISSLVPSPALNGKPNIILLHIGTNDLFARDTANMSTRLETLIDKIAQNAPSALIVLAQITPVGSTSSGHTQAEVDEFNAAQMTYNSRIPAIIQSHVAKGQHIIGVDMSQMPIPQDLTSGSVHPNDQGYEYMAGIWYAAIKDLLPR